MASLPSTPSVRSLLLSLLCCFSVIGHAQAQEPVDQGPVIEELSALDRNYMYGQRNLASELAAKHLGRNIRGERDNDLDILQDLLDRQVIKPEQTRELQSLGLVMGDLLADELAMHWVVYKDKVGRSRALRYKDTDLYLFPVTMISRRVEVGNTEPVAQIYARAVASIKSGRGPLPFE